MVTSHRKDAFIEWIIEMLTHSFVLDAKDTYIGTMNYIEELIDELSGRYAIVIVTHSMQQAARVSQRTAFFHLGLLIEYGETSQIFTNPVEERTKDYITGRYG